MGRIRVDVSPERKSLTVREAEGSVVIVEDGFFVGRAYLLASVGEVKGERRVGFVNMATGARLSDKPHQLHEDFYEAVKEDFGVIRVTILLPDEWEATIRRVSS